MNIIKCCFWLYSLHQPVKPYSALLVTSQCTPHRKVSARLHTGFASAERLEQREVDGVTPRVLCTW